MRDINVAFCLILVIEGLVIFVAPRAWQRMMHEATRLDPRNLRLIGAGAMVLGALVLGWVY